jgi:lipoprotein-releasing system ATP-binding protein
MSHFNTLKLIETKGLSKTYSDRDRGVEVLKNLDLTIETGETLAILGASGAGKSTLLNILGTLDSPSSGNFSYKGESVFSYDDKKLASFRNKNIGFVFQFHHLLREFTALENVMLPALIGGMTNKDSACKKEAKDRAKELLESVGLIDRLHHKPGELSGGEQQRTAIARALIQSPELILADEPTGNLDTKTGREVFELLVGFTENSEKNATLIVVTHNESLSALMQRRLIMADGSIEEI